MRARDVLPALAAALAFSGCSPPHGGSSGALSSAPAAATTTPGSTASSPGGAALAALTGDEDVRPLVLLHGITGAPDDWTRVVDGLAHGRTVFRDAYADDLAALAPGSVPRRSVFAVGYYKRRAADQPYFAGQGSIGGCPVPRTDGNAGLYPIAYVDNVDDAVEAILRATGASRVDMAGTSMGGVVSRAYVKWRSARGPGGQSRVDRLVLLQSPSRGINDLEAVVQCFVSLPFQRWGEVAELARDYPGWQGQSYIHHLNDGWDAFCRAHGVEYGAVFGSGFLPLNAAILTQAIGEIGRYLPGGAAPGFASGSPGPAPAAPGAQGLGVAQTPPLTTLSQALFFVDPARFDPVSELSEAFSDGDGLVRRTASSLRLGPEFPGALFDMRFHGTHAHWRDDECIQTSTNTRVVIERAISERRLPRGTRLVSANVASIAAGNAQGWIRVDYELAGGDGISAQLVTEDLAAYYLRQGIPGAPRFANVYGLPTFEGAHRVRVDGDPWGPRVATLSFYDVDGVVSEAGPFFLDVLPGTPGLEPAPATSLVAARPAGPFAASVSVASNGAGAEFSLRLVSPGSAGSWTPWTSASTLAVPGLVTGTHSLFVRSRHAANAAQELVEERDPLELGVRVDGAGNVTVSP